MILPHPSKKESKPCSLPSHRKTLPVQYEQDVTRMVVDPWQEIIDSYPKATHDCQELLTCKCKEPHGRYIHNDLHHNNVLFERTLN